MARGFESKDVEFQQAEAERVASPPRVLSAAERATLSNRQTLELALTHARHELSVTTAAVRRDTLARAVAELERQLASLPGQPQ